MRARTEAKFLGGPLIGLAAAICLWTATIARAQAPGEAAGSPGLRADERLSPERIE